MYFSTFIEVCLFISILFNIGLVYGAYLFANPLLNKNFRIWLLVRNILDRFNDSVSFEQKLPITLNLKDQSQKIIEDVEDKLLRKGYKVSNKDNSITIE